MKISILYFSVTGNTKAMAEDIAKGCNSIEDVTAHTMSISKIEEDFLQDSSCIILGSPTYYAGMAPDVKSWLHMKGNRYDLSGKLGGAFSTAGYIQGGADIAIQEILSHFLTLGMMIYSSGCACGEPPIHLGPVAISSSLDESHDLFITYGQRMAEKAKDIFRHAISTNPFTS